jgi:hypothetical protein
MELPAGGPFGARARRRNIAEFRAILGFRGRAGSPRFQTPGIAATINAPAIMAGPFWSLAKPA